MNRIFYPMSDKDRKLAASYLGRRFFKSWQIDMIEDAIQELELTRWKYFLRGGNPGRGVCVGALFRMLDLIRKRRAGCRDVYSTEYLDAPGARPADTDFSMLTIQVHDMRNLMTDHLKNVSNRLSTRMKLTGKGLIALWPDRHGSGLDVAFAIEDSERLEFFPESSPFRKATNAELTRKVGEIITNHTRRGLRKRLIELDEDFLVCQLWPEEGGIGGLQQAA